MDQLYAPVEKWATVWHGTVLVHQMNGRDHIFIASINGVLRSKPLDGLDAFLFGNHLQKFPPNSVERQH
jgi:hypothetical protein